MDKNLLRPLIPINALSDESLAELAKKTILEELPSRQILFAEGDDDALSVYLLTGEVHLSASDGQQGYSVTGGTEQARYALSQLKPRKFTGISKTPVTIARVDSRLLDHLLTWEQSTGYEVAEIEGGLDYEWMTHLMNKEVFRRLPPANISALQARFTPMPVQAGQTIIHQGDVGDYYYLILEGHADILRKSALGRKEVVFDRIQKGDGFGEDALLSGAPRNATVVMKTDGLLMRLGKRDFDELLREPLVNTVDLTEVQQLMQAGACLLDVRLEDEYRNGTIKGSINVPLYLLRVKAAGMDRKRRYITFCQSGNRSCVAAFLLTQQGFEACVLRGGLDGLSLHRNRRKAAEASASG